jgi:hypothetical protein
MWPSDTWQPPVATRSLVPQWESYSILSSEDTGIWSGSVIKKAALRTRRSTKITNPALLLKPKSKSSWLASLGFVRQQINFSGDRAPGCTKSRAFVPYIDRHLPPKTPIHIHAAIETTNLTLNTPCHTNTPSRDQIHLHLEAPSNGKIRPVKKPRIRKPSKHRYDHDRDRHGNLMCLHNKRLYYCKACGGGGICQHGKQHAQCRQCTGRFTPATRRSRNLFRLGSYNPNWVE